MHAFSFLKCFRLKKTVFHISFFEKSQHKAINFRPCFFFNRKMHFSRTCAHRIYVSTEQHRFLFNKPSNMIMDQLQHLEQRVRPLLMTYEQNTPMGRHCSNSYMEFFYRIDHVIILAYNLDIRNSLFFNNLVLLR